MKKLIIIVNIFLFANVINAQQPQPIFANNPFPKTITVSGSAEMEIIPDEIYVNVELKEYQKKVFGYGGLFFLKKQELIKPIQDKVWDAVDKVAKKNSLAIMFDKSGELVMIYTDPRHDYTDFVLDELGLGDPNDVVKN